MKIDEHQLKSMKINEHEWTSDGTNRNQRKYMKIIEKMMCTAQNQAFGMSEIS